jgi:hypothetical protein
MFVVVMVVEVEIVKLSVSVPLVVVDVVNATTVSLEYLVSSFCKLTY